MVTREDETVRGRIARGSFLILKKTLARNGERLSV